MILYFLFKDVFDGKQNEKDFKFLERVRGIEKRRSTEGCIKVPKTA